MTPRDLRTATWVQLDYPLALDNGFRIWVSKDVPGVARLAHNGKLYFRYRQRDYPNVDSVARAVNLHEKGQRKTLPGSVESIRSSR